MNVVMTGDGRFVEIQGTAEQEPFNRGQLDKLLALARAGIEAIIGVQREALAPAALPPFGAKPLPPKAAASD